MVARVENQMVHDTQAFVCHRSRLNTAQKATCHKKLEWRMQAHQLSQQAVGRWWGTRISAPSPYPYLTFRDLTIELGNRYTVPAERAVALAENHWPG